MSDKPTGADQDWRREMSLVAHDGDVGAEEEGEGSGPEEDAADFLDFRLRCEDVHEEADDGDDEL
jgi:hypothetical protein